MLGCDAHHLGIPCIKARCDPRSERKTGQSLLYKAFAQTKILCLYKAWRQRETINYFCFRNVWITVKNAMICRQNKLKIL